MSLIPKYHEVGRKNLLTYNGIVRLIENELANRQQWLDMNSLSRALEYENRALALIELLEVHNCGSIGGFDRGQQLKQSDKPSILERWEWLKNHRNNK
jgi:hypothetical protein